MTLKNNHTQQTTPTNDIRSDHLSVRTFVVDHNCVGMRLDTYLCHVISRLSRSKVQTLIDKQRIHLTRANQHTITTRANRKLQLNDRIQLTQSLQKNDVPPKAESNISNENNYNNINTNHPNTTASPPCENTRQKRLTILYEDEDIIAFDKPCGILVHPTANIHRATITAWLKINRNQTAFIIHRLDAEASGIVIVAKNRLAAKQYAKYLDNAVKSYRAICYDPAKRWPKNTHQTLTHPLGFAGITLPHITMGYGNLNATTHLCSLTRHGKLNELNIEIETGRQHQIRVHLAMEKTPILGDKLYYFGEAAYRDDLDGKLYIQRYPNRLMLHAHKLVLPTPNNELVLCSTPPWQIKDLLPDPISTKQQPPPVTNWIDL